MLCENLWVYISFKILALIGAGALITTIVFVFTCYFSYLRNSFNQRR